MNARRAPPIVGILWVGLALSAPADGRSRRVPLEYPTIQAAIDSAAAGDSVVVGPGTYAENLRIAGKPLTLRSEAGPEVTTVDGAYQGPAVQIESASTIQGFTFRRGQGAMPFGGSVCVYGSAVIVKGNIITEGRGGFGTDASWGGGVLVHGMAVIEDNIIRDNRAILSGAGIAVMSGQSVIRNNRIENNRTEDPRGGGAGIFVETGWNDPTLVEHNVILANDAAEESGGGIYVRYNAVVRRNTVVGNQGGGIRAENSLVRGNISAENAAYGIQASCSQVECNDSWANDGADFLLEPLCQPVQLSNISSDPMFCDPDRGDYHLSPGSPCAGTNPYCLAMGALPVDCPITPALPSPWGRLKARYR